MTRKMRKALEELRDISAAILAEEGEEGVKGPERRLVAQAAERAEQQGAAEDSREGRRVAPGEAPAKYPIAAVVLCWRKEAAKMAARFPNERGDLEAVSGRAFASAMETCADMIDHYVQPEPDSGADALEWTPSENPPPKPTREP